MAAVSQNIFFNQALTETGNFLEIDALGQEGKCLSALQDVKSVAGKHFGNKRNAQGAPIFTIADGNNSRRMLVHCDSDETRGIEILRYVHSCIPSSNATLDQVKDGLSAADRA